MKESNFLSPLGSAAGSLTAAGRSARRNLGDLEPHKTTARPLKGFQTAMAGSKSGASEAPASQSETSQATGRQSNASILAAIGANSVASRQIRVDGVDGAGRAPSAPPRGNPAPSPGGPDPDTPNPTPQNPPASGLKFNAMQQNWLDANTGSYAEILKNNLSRTKPFELKPVDVRWANLTSGKPELLQRGVGNITPESGQELAALFGGRLVNSPFATFGTSQQDQYIRMPNGQMVEASVLASQLNAARTAADPFSATQSVLEIYRIEGQRFDLAASTDAVDLVTKGTLNHGLPAYTLS